MVTGGSRCGPPVHHAGPHTTPLVPTHSLPARRCLQHHATTSSGSAVAGRNQPTTTRRGIGLGLVKKFLARDNTVIATARKSAEAPALQELVRQYPAGRLLLSDADTSQAASVASWAEGVRAATRHVDVRRVSSGVAWSGQRMRSWAHHARVHA